MEHKRLQKTENNNVKIQNFIFTWNQYVDNAIVMESKLKKYGNTTVINSNVNNKRDWWINLNDAYFAEQWNTLVRNIETGVDFVFHIQSDATVHNFDELYSKFYEITSKYNIGIYAPDVNYTWHKYDVNLLNKLEENVYEVPNTDCTCWFLNTSIIKNNIIYDPTTNYIGYGSDWYYSAESLLQKKYVVRDYSIQIHHPSNKNYDNEKANSLFNIWMNEQNSRIKEKIQFLMEQHSRYFINSHSWRKEASIPTVNSPNEYKSSFIGVVQAPTALA